MMKNLPRTLKWLIAIAISIVCLIGCRIALPVVLFILILIPDPEFILRAMTLGGLVACLAVSYIYIVKRSDNKTGVRLVYAIVGLLVVSSYVFSEYQTRRGEAAIRDVYTQFIQAMREEDYETAYEFMLPDYRQTHSPAAFEMDHQWIVSRNYRVVRVSILHPAFREGQVSLPDGSLTYVFALKKLDQQWYLTGEYSAYQTLASGH